MSKLDIQNLAKSFGDLQVIKDLSFSINEGEFVSILGPSGSGKSTLFQMIGGISLPDSGSILIEGQQVNGKTWGHQLYPSNPFPLTVENNFAKCSTRARNSRKNQ